MSAQQQYAWGASRPAICCHALDTHLGSIFNRVMAAKSAHLQLSCRAPWTAPRSVHLAAQGGGVAPTALNCLRSNLRHTKNNEKHKALTCHAPP